MPSLHVALVAPEIPWNTGNVGRTCLATGARLHLVRPLGFRLDEKSLRRAGLDYWPQVDPVVWPSWLAFDAALPSLGKPLFFTAEAERSLFDVPIETPTVLVFGSESTGLPADLREAYRNRLVRIPMIDGPVRSLNLSTAVAVAVYEVVRRLRSIASTDVCTVPR